MDLRQLKYFVTIVELKSFTKAAEKLWIAQPALGTQMKKLEGELEIQLLFRHSRGVDATEAGVLLYQHAQRLLKEAQSAKQALWDLKGPPRGPVSIGMQPNAMTMLTSVMVRRCLSEFPNVALDVVEEFASVLTEWVGTGRLDIACTFERPDIPGVGIEPLLQEKFFFVGAHGSPANGTTPITLAEVARYPLILPQASQRLRQLMIRTAQSAGLSLQVNVEAQSEALIRELCTQGLGYSTLPFSSVQKQVARAELFARKIIDPQIVSTMYLIYRQPLTKAGASVVQVIKEIVQEKFDASDTTWLPPALGAEMAVTEQDAFS